MPVKLNKETKIDYLENFKIHFLLLWLVLNGVAGVVISSNPWIGDEIPAIAALKLSLIFLTSALAYKFLMGDEAYTDIGAGCRLMKSDWISTLLMFISSALWVQNTTYHANSYAEVIQNIPANVILVSTYAFFAVLISQIWNYVYKKCYFKVNNIKGTEAKNE